MAENDGAASRTGSVAFSIGASGGVAATVYSVGRTAVRNQAVLVCVGSAERSAGMGSSFAGHSRTVSANRTGAASNDANFRAKVRD